MAAQLTSINVDGAVTERGTAFYIVIAAAVEGGERRQWAVARRYSHFVDFRRGIEPLLTDLAPGMDQLPFPEKGWGTGTASETIEERMSMFQTWIAAVSEVVLDEAMRDAGLPQLSQASEQLTKFLEDDMSIAKETLDGLGLDAPDQRRLYGPVVDREDMNENVRRELLAAEEEHLPRGWQFNQRQPTDEENDAAELSEAALSEKQLASPASRDSPTPSKVAVAQIRPEELAGRLVDGDGKQVAVTFCEPGQVGIQYMRATGAWSKGVNQQDRAVALVVQEILPGSLASQHASLRPGLILTKIDGMSIKGAHFEHSMRRMKGARPLNLTFEGIEGLRCAPAVATPSTTVGLQTPLSTGRTPRLEPSGTQNDETDWESTDESEPAVEPRLFAPELARHVIDAVKLSKLCGFVFCPNDGYGDPRQVEIRALETAEAMKGANSAVRYYVAPESPKREWGFNHHGDYVMVMGEVLARAEANFVEEWYTLRASETRRAPSFVVRSGCMADVCKLRAASGDGVASREAEGQTPNTGGTDGGLGHVGALAAETLSSEQLEGFVMVVEISGESVMEEQARIVAVMVLSNAAGGLAEERSLAGAAARVQVATASAYRRKGLGELLLKVAAGVAMALGGASAIEALVPREVSSNTERNDNQSANCVEESSVMRLLRREGYSEDLNLGEGTHARLLLVLHASMREASIAPLDEDRVEPENTDLDEQVELNAST